MPDLEAMHHHRHRGSPDADLDLLPDLWTTLTRPWRGLLRWATV